MRTASADAVSIASVRDCILIDSWNHEPSTDCKALCCLITYHYPLNWVAQRFMTEIKDEGFACGSLGFVFPYPVFFDCKFLFSSHVSLPYMSSKLFYAICES